MQLLAEAQQLVDLAVERAQPGAGLGDQRIGVASGGRCRCRRARSGRGGRRLGVARLGRHAAVGRPRGGVELLLELTQLALKLAERRGDVSAPSLIWSPCRHQTYVPAGSRPVVGLIREPTSRACWHFVQQACSSCIRRVNFSRIDTTTSAAGTRMRGRRGLPPEPTVASSGRPCRRPERRHGQLDELPSRRGSRRRSRRPRSGCARRARPWPRAPRPLPPRCPAEPDTIAPAWPICLARGGGEAGDVARRPAWSRSSAMKSAASSSAEPPISPAMHDQLGLRVLLEQRDDVDERRARGPGRRRCRRSCELPKPRWASSLPIW